MKPTVVLALFASVAAFGCKKNVDLGGEYRTVLDVEPEALTKLDVLVVVDNSGSMAPWQRDLVDAAGARLFGMLETELGELPDLHVAVVSTDVGAGAYNISGCAGHGDDGRFLSEPRTADCPAPAGAFLSDSPDGEGGRVRNFDGELAAAFGCIAKLGVEGCGFEQPLEAARRALDGRHPENAGFMRDDALLLVVVLTDEDDCSAFEDRMFDTAQNNLHDPLGPLSSFRCFEFGVTCDDDVPRVPGERSSCAPREESPFMYSVSELAAFFRGLKADPSHVAVSIMSGGAGPVVVEKDFNDNPSLAPLCVRPLPPECDSIVWPPDAGPEEPDAGPGELPDAGLIPADCLRTPSPAPSVRLNAFMDEFPGRAEFTSLCELGGVAAHLESTARLAADVMGRRGCLRGTLLDAQRDRSGVQPACRAYEAPTADSPIEERTSVPSCAESGGAEPCLEIVESSECAHVESKLAVRVDRDERSAASGHLLVECLVPRDE